jgi:hypothetical protein
MSIVRRFTLLAAAALVVGAALAPGAAQASWAVASWTLPATDSQFAGSACVSTTFCIQAGYQTPGATRGLLYKYNGTTYDPTTPASTTSEFYGVGCNSTTFCMAVGTDFAAGTPGHAEKYNGTAWSNITTATPAGATLTELRGVSCASATHCVAAGRFQNATTNVGLIETYNGTSFSQSTTTPPAGTTASQLNDVACSATSTCTAVGWYDSSSPRKPLVYRFNGASWSTQVAALPAGATGAELNGVACPSATSCQAVGSYLDGSTVQHALAQTWNGTAWSLKTVPDPTGGGTDPNLDDVACYVAPSSGCAAVGNYTGAGGNTEPLAAGYNGSSWTLQTVPRAAGTSDAQLRSVSCPTSTSCRGVGVSFYDGSTGTTGLRPAIDVGQ